MSEQANQPQPEKSPESVYEHMDRQHDMLKEKADQVPPLDSHVQVNHIDFGDLGSTTIVEAPGGDDMVAYSSRRMRPLHTETGTPKNIEVSSQPFDKIRGTSILIIAKPAGETVDEEAGLTVAKPAKVVGYEVKGLIDRRELSPAEIDSYLVKIYDEMEKALNFLIEEAAKANE